MNDSTENKKYKDNSDEDLQEKKKSWFDDIDGTLGALFLVMAGVLYVIVNEIISHLQ